MMASRPKVIVPPEWRDIDTDSGKNRGERGARRENALSTISARSIELALARRRDGVLRSERLESDCCVLKNGAERGASRRSDRRSHRRAANPDADRSQLGW